MFNICYLMAATIDVHRTHAGQRLHIILVQLRFTYVLRTMYYYVFTWRIAHFSFTFINDLRYFYFSLRRKYWNRQKKNQVNAETFICSFTLPFFRFFAYWILSKDRVAREERKCLMFIFSWEKKNLFNKEIFFENRFPLSLVLVAVINIDHFI